MAALVVARQDGTDVGTDVFKVLNGTLGSIAAFSSLSVESQVLGQNALTEGL